MAFFHAALGSGFAADDSLLGSGAGDQLMPS
jgi:hypothetical protein